MWIMACLPIIVLLLLLIKFQWGATEAAPIGLLITIITAVAFYKADFTLTAFPEKEESGRKTIRTAQGFMSFSMR